MIRLVGSVGGGVNVGCYVVYGAVIRESTLQCLCFSNSNSNADANSSRYFLH